MAINIILAILAGLLLIVGVIGAFLPVLPGPPFAWAGILVGFFCGFTKLSVPCLIITAIVAVLVMITDSFMPTIMTNRFGGSKAATTGSTIGIIVGLFIGPIGLILGPFFGALIGESIHTKGEMKTSFKSAFGAFLGFICGTGLKFTLALFYILIFGLSFKFKI